MSADPNIDLAGFREPKNPVSKGPSVQDRSHRGRQFAQKGPMERKIISDRYRGAKQPNEDPDQDPPPPFVQRRPCPATGTSRPTAEKSSTGRVRHSRQHAESVRRDMGRKQRISFNFEIDHCVLRFSCARVPQ